jgi:hypothetical protein
METRKWNGSLSESQMVERPVSIQWLAISITNVMETIKYTGSLSVSQMSWKPESRMVPCQYHKW